MRKRNLVGLLLGIQGILILMFLVLLVTKQQVNSISSSITPPQDVAVPMLFTGDVMIGRHVETLMQQHGAHYPFEKISGLFGSSTTIINLEGPIPEQHLKTPDFTTNFSFSTDYAIALPMNGVTLASLANNHTFDKGEGAYWHTKQTLSDIAVYSFGHPREIGKESFFVHNNGNQKIYLVGLNDAVSEYFDPEAAVDLIKNLRSAGDKSLIFVYIHWGNEYQLTSNTKQQELAHAFIDNGADAVIGHHPHVVQEIEVYDDKPIFYSLGNLIFDQYFSKDTQEGLMVQAEIQKDYIRYNLLPVDIIKSQPDLMKGEALTDFLNRLADRSDEEISERVRLGTITIGR